MKNLLFIIASIILIMNCRKEISVDLPESETKLVVDGRIELGSAPFIILSKSSPYFGNTNVSDIKELYQIDANITISDGVNTEQLIKICPSNLTEEQLLLISQTTGIDLSFFASYNICIYTSLNMIGEIGKTYSIDVDWNGKHYKSESKMNNIISPKKYELVQGLNIDQNSKDLKLIMDEPGNENNYYRYFFTKKQYNDTNGIYTINDNSIINIFDDRVVNGLNDFSFNFTQLNQGDTCIFKLSNIDEKVFDFFDNLNNQNFNQGNVFSTPINVPSNISNGGLGVWAAYSYKLDTIIYNIE